MNNESPMLKLLDENVAQGPVAGVPADLAIRHDDYLAESSLDRHSAKTR